METMTTSKYKIGDRVEVVDHHWQAPYSGTVVDVDTDHGEPRYDVRKVEPDREHATFVEAELEPDTYGFLDLDDIGQIRAELVDTVTGDSHHTGLSADTRGERLRTANRIAFLASRLAWLETCDLMHESRMQ